MFKNNHLESTDRMFCGLKIMFFFSGSSLNKLPFLSIRIQFLKITLTSLLSLNNIPFLSDFKMSHFNFQYIVLKKVKPKYIGRVERMPNDRKQKITHKNRSRGRFMKRGTNYMEENFSRIESPRNW